MQVRVNRWRGPRGPGGIGEGGVVHPIVREDGGAGDGPRGHGQKARVGLTRWDGQQGRVWCLELTVWTWAGPTTGFMGTLSSWCWAVAKLQLRVWMSVVAFFSSCPGERVCEKTPNVKPL